MQKTCWAHLISSCCEDISREHVVARSSAIGKSVTFNPPFSNEIKTVGLNSATAHILCRKHNSELGYLLDKEAGNALRNIHLVHGNDLDKLKVAKRLADRHYRLMVDGRIMERWFYKTLVNMLVADYTLPSGAAPFQKPLIANWGRYIFDGAPVPREPFGLYAVNIDDTLFRRRNFFSQQYRIVRREGEIIDSEGNVKSRFSKPELLLYSNTSMQFILNVGVELGPTEIVRILNEEQNLKVTPGRITYRPIAFQVKRRDTLRTICFDWHDDRAKPPEFFM